MDTIEGAQKEIIVCTYVFDTNSVFASLLLKCVQRDVSVNIIVDKTKLDNKEIMKSFQVNFDAAVACARSKGFNSNCNFLCYASKELFHVKYLVVDKRFVVAGSLRAPCCRTRLKPQRCRMRQRG